VPFGARAVNWTARWPTLRLPTGAVENVKISVEVEELEPGLTNSHFVADYLRAMLKLKALRRAVGETLLEVELCKAKLNATRLAEAQKLLDGGEANRQRFRLLPRPKRSQ
jgi:hypothetical protein